MFRLLLSFGLCVLGVSSALAQTRMVSHITDINGGFATSIVVENTGATTQSLTLTPYASDGTALDAVQLDVDASSVFRSEAHALLGDSASHFTIEGSDDVKVNTFYDFKSGANASPAFVGESQEQGSSWRLFPGNWDQVFDGIAVVNTGSEPTDVWIAQKDDHNNVVTAKKVADQLAPNAKALFVVGSPTIRDFDASVGYFEVSGDQLLDVTALQGTLENDTLNILLATENRPLSQATSRRDDKGVWFIEDGSMYDVLEMMGYNVAGDRLWQMESFRRQARGTLGEIVSIAAVPQIADVDVANRTRAFSNEELDQYYAGLDDETKTAIQAYIAGVNRRIAQINSDPDTMPLEFVALGVAQITSWDHRDLMAHLANFQQGFSMRTFGSEQVLNAALLQNLEAKYGAEQAAIMFNDLRYISDPQAMTMVAGESQKQAARKEDQTLPVLRNDLPDLRQGLMAYAERMERNRQTLEDHGMLIKGGSYAWVVSGDKTETGNPMLYSGPQVGFSAPVLFVEGSIVSDSMTVSGMAIPGIPGIIVGRTPHHAWSMQVGYAGTWDYYIESADNITVARQELVKIKDGDDILLDIEVSPRGPVLQQLGDLRLAYKYSHRDYNWNIATGILNLARAQNMDEFGEAVENLAVSQHLCYTDKDGNIAYWHSGRQPVRPAGDYRVPQGMLANQDILEWDAAVVEPLIHERNPAKGYFGGWNNKPGPTFIDYSATTALGPYHRGHTIKDYFEAYDPADKYTFEDIRDLAAMISNSGGFAAGGNPWTRLGDAITAAINANPTAERNEVLEMFQNWDGHNVEGGFDAWVSSTTLQDASVFMDALIPQLMAKTFEDELGAPTGDQDFITRFQVFVHGIYEDGLNNSYDWFSNLEDATAPQTAEAIILESIDELYVALGPRPWGVNARGSITYPHVLFGPITVLGITTPTPLANRSTYAHCVEYGETGPVRIESFFALGQSGTITGTPFAPAFDENALSMKEFFDAFVMRAFPLFQ